MTDADATDDGDATLSPRERRDMSPERMLFFSDGVFAIIITILVLEIKIPELGSGIPLAESLTELRPSILAFIVSFLLVGMYWVAHRSAFSQVRYVDRNTIWLNLLYLMPASMVPFVAGVLGEYPDEPSALHLYGVVLTVLTVFLMVLRFYLARHPGLLWQPESKEKRRVSMIVSGAPIVVYLIAMLVATWEPLLALLLFLSIPVLYFGLISFLKTDPRTRVAAEDL